MLKENLDKIFSEIKNGNNYGERVTLVGAIKTVSAETINEAIKMGLSVIAENKVQEFREKDAFIDKNCTRHFIGHLQTNKVKYIVGKVDTIQSVDSIHLAEAISKEAVKKGVTQNIFAEINIGGELSKSGFNPENAYDSVKQLTAFPAIRVTGIMAMLPKSDDETYLSSLVKKTREIFDNLKKEYGLKYLSIGMSSDYKIAIENGSNMIRLGTVIFGKRNYEVDK